MSDAAAQQPSPTKRGRGRGRGGAGRGAASARARGKPATGRRGRAKVYDTSRAQAAHERQRDLKNAYATLSAAMKPALEELADRNLDRLKSDFNAHKEVDEYHEITSFLDQRLQHRLSEVDTKFKLSIASRTHQFNAQAEYTDQSFKVCISLILASFDLMFVFAGHLRLLTRCQNRCADKVEDYHDVLLRRLDILEQLYQNREPIDVSAQRIFYSSLTCRQVNFTC